jgi:WD40 repeat protein
MWKVPEGVELAALNGHAQGIVGLGFIPGGKGLFSASMDGTVRLWVVGPDAVD